ncbi:unnamed protein product [Oncorhynchus mykiss]|uniref:Uncharacterized protein n=1 Tax=Oncorhynchus mykiss TaxID=8022 RepID=A0A060ZAH5_ONCMY|nr:unnamed protein product [Oncorhynchus mykiss]
MSLQDSHPRPPLSPPTAGHVTHFPSAPHPQGLSMAPVSHGNEPSNDVPRDGLYAKVNKRRQAPPPTMADR